MLPRPQRQLAVSLSLVALAACGESQAPTQPETGVAAVSRRSGFRPRSEHLDPEEGLPSGLRRGGTDGRGGPQRGRAIDRLHLRRHRRRGGSCVHILAYNVATNVWTSTGSEPRICTFNMNGAGRIGNTLYVTGGSTFAGGSFFTGDNATWAYNAATNQLTTKTDQPKLTSNGITGVIDGKVFVLPGSCGFEFFPTAGYCETEPFRRLFRYNPATNLWATKKPAPHFHISGAGGVINGKFYVAGGDGEASLDAYDPATDTWKTLAPLPIAGGAKGAVLQGKLFVVVSTPVGSTIQRHAYAYDPATNIWTPKAAPRRDHPAIVAVTFGGRPALLGVGGIRFTPSPTANESELYTP